MGRGKREDVWRKSGDGEWTVEREAIGGFEGGALR